MIRTGRPRLRFLALTFLATVAFGCSDSSRNEAGAISREGVAGGSQDQEPGADLLTGLDERTPELQFALSPWLGDLAVARVDGHRCRPP